MRYRYNVVQFDGYLPYTELECYLNEHQIQKEDIVSISQSIQPNFEMVIVLVYLKECYY